MFISYDDANNYLGQKSDRPVYGKAHTRIMRQDDSGIAIIYHETSVFVYYPDYVLLNAGNHETKTTKDRINDCLADLFDNVRLRQANNRFILIASNGASADFYNGIKLDYNGLILTDKQPTYIFSTSLDISERSYEINTTGYNRDDVRQTLRRIEQEISVYLVCGEMIGKICESAINPNSPKPSKIIGKAVLQDGKTLTDEQKERFGSMFSAILRRDTYTLKLTHGCEGSARDYYHAGSCWWGGYSESRNYLTRANGGAFRAYDNDGDLIGRIWYIPYEDGIVIFNSYGQNDLQHSATWARDIATMLNTRFGKCALDIRCETGEFYLNMAQHFYVGPTPENHQTIRINLPEPIRYYCDCCERRYDNDNLIHWDGRNICPHCLDNYYVIPVDEHDLYHVDECIRIHNPNDLRGNYSYYLRNHPDLVTTVTGLLVHKDNALYDVYGNAHTNRMGQFGSTCFEDEITGEIYPIEERITLTSGFRIARSNFDPSIHVIETAYNRYRPHTFQLWY